MGNALINGEEFQMQRTYGKGDRTDIQKVVQEYAARGRCPNIIVNVMEAKTSRAEAAVALTEIQTKPPFPNLIMVGWIKQVWIVGKDEGGEFVEQRHYQNSASSVASPKPPAV